MAGGDIATGLKRKNFYGDLMDTEARRAQVAPEGAAGLARRLPSGAKQEAAGLMAQADYFRRKGDQVRAAECKERAQQLMASI